MYSAFCCQPEEIHKKGGKHVLARHPRRQDEKHSSSHAALCLQVFEGYHLTGNYSNPDEREYKRHEKSFCGLGGKELANRSDHLDLKVRSLADSVNLLLHDEHVNTTPRLRAELQTAKSLWPILRTPGRCGWVEGQCFSFIFVHLKLVMDGPLSYVTNTGLHVQKIIIINQCWSEELNCITQCHRQNIIMAYDSVVQ